MNILELIEEYMDQGMSEEDASNIALYEINPEAYAEAMYEDDNAW